MKLHLQLSEIALIALASALPAQESHRSAKSIEAERAAKELFSSGDYDKAIPFLERALNADPLDLRGQSLLAMAYLYSSSRTDLAANLPRAQAAMDKLVADGGEAVFLVGRGDDPRGAIHMVKVIQGELRIKKDSISFVPSRSSNGALGPLGNGEVRECGLNRGYGKSNNAFHFKVLKDTINFRPLHFSKDESELVCTLMEK